MNTVWDQCYQMDIAGQNNNNNNNDTTYGAPHKTFTMKIVPEQWWKHTYKVY